jgi:integrase
MTRKRAAGEGTLRQRVDGSWEWRTPSGFPVKKSFTAKRQEDVLLKRDVFLKDFGEGVNFDAQKITLNDFLETWLETTVRVNTRRATFEHHARIARNHILPTLGHLQLPELTPAHVQTLYAAKFDAGYALSTRRHIHVTLGKALKQAVKWHYLTTSPTAGAEVPQADAALLDYEDLPDPDMGILEEWQAKRFLATAKEHDPRHWALYVLALATGMRQGEILGLPRTRLDLTRRLVRVRQTLVLVKGGFEFGRPKTRASKRDIELRAEAVEVLRLHHKLQLEERMRLGGLPKDYGLVFSTTVGTPIRRQNLQRRSFKPLLEEAGLPDIRFHDLRHTFASIALGRGANINTVSKMLGHSSVKITLDVYGHLMPGMQSEALGHLDGVFT